MQTTQIEDTGQRRSWGLGVLAVLTLGGLALGLWCFHPYFEQEHRRMEPWKTVLIWTGDAVALGWFLRFVTGHFVQGRPLRSRSWADFKHEKEYLVALGSLLFAIGTDLAITLYLMQEDRAAFANAEVVVGQADSVKSHFHPETNHYELHVRYNDRHGGQHGGRFLVEERRDKGFPAAVPKQTVEALWDGRVPFAVRISYDPAWPDRAWLTDFGWDDGNRIHYFSLIVLVIQVAGLLLFAEALAIVAYSSGRVPWWFDLYKACPFLVEVAFIALVGPFFRMEGFWVWT
jgi:hypothetical protein